MSFHISEVLKSVVKRFGLEEELLKGKLPEFWRLAVGDRLAELTEIKMLRAGTLFIHVSSAPWRSEVTLRKEEIRNKLNAQIGREAVKEIIVR